MGGARYRANCLPGLWEPFKRDTVDLATGQLKERAGFLVDRNLTLSFASKWAGGDSMAFPAGPKKKHC